MGASHGFFLSHWKACSYLLTLLSPGGSCSRTGRLALSYHLCLCRFSIIRQNNRSHLPRTHLIRSPCLCRILTTLSIFKGVFLLAGFSLATQIHSNYRTYFWKTRASSERSRRSLWSVLQTIGSWGISEQSAEFSEEKAAVGSVILPTFQDVHSKNPMEIRQYRTQCTILSWQNTRKQRGDDRWAAHRLWLLPPTHRSYRHKLLLWKAREPCKSSFQCKSTSA